MEEQPLTLAFEAFDEEPATAPVAWTLADKDAFDIRQDGNLLWIKPILPIRQNTLSITDGESTYMVRLIVRDTIKDVVFTSKDGAVSLAQENAAVSPPKKDDDAVPLIRVNAKDVYQKAYFIAVKTLGGSVEGVEYSVSGASADAYWSEGNLVIPALELGMTQVILRDGASTWTADLTVEDQLREIPVFPQQMFTGRTYAAGYASYYGTISPEVTSDQPNVLKAAMSDGKVILEALKPGLAHLTVKSGNELWEHDITVLPVLKGITPGRLDLVQGQEAVVQLVTSEDTLVRVDVEGIGGLLTVSQSGNTLSVNGLAEGSGTLSIYDESARETGQPFTIPFTVTRAWKISATENSDDHEMVLSIEDALLALGYGFGKPDGVWDNNTDNALSKYKADNHLEGTASLSVEERDVLLEKGEQARLQSTMSATPSPSAQTHVRAGQDVSAAQAVSAGNVMYVLDSQGYLLKYSLDGSAPAFLSDSCDDDANIRFAGLWTGDGIVWALSTEGQLFVWGEIGSLCTDISERELPGALLLYPDVNIRQAAISASAIALLHGPEEETRYGIKIAEGNCMYWAEDAGQEGKALFTGAKETEKNLLANVRRVTIYGKAAAALNNKGKLYLWGAMDQPLLYALEKKKNGLPYAVEAAIKVGSKTVKCDDTLLEMDNAHICLNSPQGLLIAGDNSLGQLGTGTVDNVKGFAIPLLPDGLPLMDVKKVICAESYILALTYGGSLYGWGDNSQGQLGLQASGPVTTPVLLPCSDLTDISLAGTGRHLATMKDGSILIFGIDTPLPASDAETLTLKIPD
jgi:hypothetical protein